MIEPHSTQTPRCPQGREYHIPMNRVGPGVHESTNAHIPLADGAAALDFFSLSPMYGSSKSSSPSRTMFRLFILVEMSSIRSSTERDCSADEQVREERENTRENNTKSFHMSILHQHILPCGSAITPISNGQADKRYSGGRSDNVTQRLLARCVRRWIGNIQGKQTNTWQIHTSEDIACPCVRVDSGKYDNVVSFAAVALVVSIDRRRSMAREARPLLRFTLATVGGITVCITTPNNKKQRARRIHHALSPIGDANSGKWYDDGVRVHRHANELGVLWPEHLVVLSPARFQPGCSHRIIAVIVLMCTVPNY